MQERFSAPDETLPIIEDGPIQDDPVWREQRAELEARQAQVRERKAEANGRVRRRPEPSIARGGAYQPDVSTTPGGTERAPQRARPAQRRERDAAGSPERDGGTLGDGRAGYGISESFRGRTAGERARGAAASRQDARQAIPLATDFSRFNALRDRVEATLQQVFAYAGIDVSGSAAPLNASEVDEYTTAIAELVVRIGVVLDYGLTHLNRDKVESDIWAFSEEESQILARFYLKRASRIGWMAKAARQVVRIKEAGDLPAVAEIMGKRMIASPIFVMSNGGVRPWIKS